MSPAEVVSRGQDKARQAAWSRQQVRPGEALPALPAGPPRTFTAVLPGWARDKVDASAREAVVAAASRMLAGEWEVLGTPVPGIVDPDWFLDPVTGRRAPDATYAFRVDHRDESVTGNVKAVWELSRHHHVTVLAAAYWLTDDERYAELAAAHLRSWWTANPFLSGVHWTSGIEIGIRLVSWAWTRRLLDGWPGAAGLFEDEPLCVRQVWWHQRWLDGFRSSGTSANNHVVAEAVGRLVGACAFPWYDESPAWRDDARAQLATELGRNTFGSGINREQATDYHRFVLELGLVAGAEADAAGHPLDEATWALLARSADAMAALSDVAGRPPRQGDGDEGRGLVVDDDLDPWALLLGVSAEVFGAASWWPAAPASVASVVVPALAAAHRRTDDGERPSHFADAGATVLRSTDGGPEIWCRCDGGPHGFLAIAAHGHADALSLEVRHDGVEVLVDPGTYCYHGEPEWRSYFRSTRAHNTVEVDGVNQSREGGPFLWTQQATSQVEQAGPSSWTARVTGLDTPDPALVHRRTARLEGRVLHVADEVRGGTTHDVRLAWHLGPAVDVALAGTTATLTWDRGSARVALPADLTWTAHRGETEPVLGWYSPAFGTKVPSTTLVGHGRGSSFDLATTFDFEEPS